MKYKTTARALRNGYYTIISVGYCELQNLLSYESPVAFCCGVYGWNFDVYDIDGVAIATGYRGMPSKNDNGTYTLARKYDDLACGRSVQEKDTLIREFINEAKADKGVLAQ